MICVTDEPAGIAPGIEVLPDFGDWTDVPSPHGRAAPSCYRRLRAFHPEAGQWFGERFVCLDLDCVVVGDLEPLWGRPDEFVIWQDPLYPRQFCGSMWLLQAGSRPRVWQEFNPRQSPRVAAERGYRGSDQAWISYLLAGSPKWTRADGVLSYRADVKGRPLPAGTRIVMFHGPAKPWQLSNVEWIAQHY